MIWQVAHAIPGRVRLKGPLRAMSDAALRSLLQRLQQAAGIKVAACSRRTQTILITYSGGPAQRAVIRDIILQTPDNAPAPLIHENYIGPKDWLKKLTHGNNSVQPRNPIPAFLLRRIFCPSPIRHILGVWRALPYIATGLRVLLNTRKLTVPVLDASALAAALLRRDFASISTVTFLFSLSQYLEYSTHKKSRQNLELGLKMLAGRECWLLKDGQEVQIPLSKVQKGDVLVLRTGQEAPVDGIIVQGEAMVNLAILTGESVAQHRVIGDWLHAGAALEDGCVHLQAVNIHGDTKFSRIIEFIDQAEEYKAKIQTQAESRADALVPASFAGALLTAVLTRDSAKVASVLMVDYSCAIRLSTPLSILSAMRSWVDSGMLVKGGKFLEALALADTVVFDKTGTLTKASPQVADIISFSKYGPMEILRLAACLEEHFPHPLGRAVVSYADQHRLRHREEHAQVEYIAAHGIVSRLHGDKVLLGSAHFMADEGIVSTAAIRACMEQQAGRSLLYLAVNRHIIGLLALEDPVRPDAAALIKSLRNDDITVHMLTGDGPETAKTCAALLGIEHYRAQMLPEDKAAYIQRLKNEGRHIIMVGDGINDSPALALADAGVTLQDGSELARNVADVVLTRNNISDLGLARSLGKQALRRIHHNYIGIVSINSLLLLLGITGVITPASSALLHNASTILSALNGMRSFKKSIFRQN